MQMQYQLAVLDLDGTMLSTDGELPVTVRRSIAAVKARGIKVTLATGRRICRTLPWARTLEIDIPVVAHNGAVVVNPESGAVVSKQGISLSAANQVIDELLHLNIPFLVYRGEDQGEMGLLLEQFSQHRTEFLTFIDDQVELVSKLDLKSNPIKIAVLGQDYQLNPLLDDWQERYGSAANLIVYRSDNYIGVDFICRDCSKKSGVEYILKQLDLDFSRVLAIGDDYNDLALIEAAGLGAAMGNAPVPVKQAADYIAPTNDEDGVAHVLQQFCLPREME